MKKNSYGPAYAPLLALSALFGMGAVITLIPNPGASWPNIMGYSSVCTFAPGAAFACALLAAITCTIRARLVRRWTAPAFIPILAIAALGLGLAVSTVAWAGVKAEYSDSTSAASAIE
ncbi:MAG: hypothetical protein CVV47_06755 [Spirochaetae bacterium HGW-Spirochaetae-3]|jgi:hypothetical protein|nr:MAG: hypothetical protein CVV47_06755 [Spirochaetae bacterium HGW-Spirochaetae-3]